MYFEINPKTEKKNLFGVDYNLHTLLNAFSDNSSRLIIIKGLRRVGKTSLLNVALAESTEKTVKIDVRDSPFYDRKEFFLFFIKRIESALEKNILEKIIQKITGVSLSYKGISLELLFSNDENIKAFFENLNHQLLSKNKRIIIAFDEIQLLKEIKFDYFIASFFDNYNQLKIVLTGSEIGLLDKFLGKKDYQSPLFGRAYLEIELKPLKEVETERFLEQGFKQINKKISFEEVKEVIEMLDGIIGWATYYGWLRSKGISHQKSLERVGEEGKEIVKRELDQFLKGRKARMKYIKVLKNISKGNNQWITLKTALQKEEMIITDSQLNLYLKELIDYGIIERIEERYYPADPLILRAVRE